MNIMGASFDINQLGQQYKLDGKFIQYNKTILFPRLLIRSLCLCNFVLYHINFELIYFLSFLIYWINCCTYKKNTFKQVAEFIQELQYSLKESVQLYYSRSCVVVLKKPLNCSGCEAGQQRMRKYFSRCLKYANFGQFSSALCMYILFLHYILFDVWQGQVYNIL